MLYYFLTVVFPRLHEETHLLSAPLSFQLLMVAFKLKFWWFFTLILGPTLQSLMYGRKICCTVKTFSRTYQNSDSHMQWWTRKATFQSHMFSNNDISRFLNVQCLILHNSMGGMKTKLCLFYSISNSTNI